MCGFASSGGNTIVPPVASDTMKLNVWVLLKWPDGAGPFMVTLLGRGPGGSPLGLFS